MGIKEYISDNISFLELENFTENKKINVINKILYHLNNKKNNIEKILTKKHGKKLKKKLIDDLDFINSQIKKGNKYIKKLEGNL